MYIIFLFFYNQNLVYVEFPVVTQLLVVQQRIRTRHAFIWKGKMNLYFPTDVGYESEEKGACIISMEEYQTLLYRLNSGFQTSFPVSVELFPCKLEIHCLRKLNFQLQLIAHMSTDLCGNNGICIMYTISIIQ